ncbi:Leucine-rich repeat-containing protein 74A [Holothuria leucospilota]|uniref:Leucine-rich repeat-containing protein 74A n=1 Tax=Holothuria leucospilota TaxID=206669 RepID=A0A9Q1CMQ5_HOLLE|nr:Leucine-rich repeat-containing protein 74A [Holothuria leucospilota]
MDQFSGQAITPTTHKCRQTGTTPMSALKNSTNAKPQQEFTVQKPSSRQRNRLKPTLRPTTTTPRAQKNEENSTLRPKSSVGAYDINSKVSRRKKREKSVEGASSNITDVEIPSEVTPSKSPRLEDSSPNFLNSLLESKQKEREGTRATGSPAVNHENLNKASPPLEEPSTWSTLISQRDQSYTPQADDIEEIPWAVTELPPTESDDDALERSRTRQSFLSLAITKEEGEDDEEAGVQDGEEEDDPEEKFREERQRQLREAAKSLLFEPDSFKNEDYDTDLEEDFHEEPEPKLDEAGVSVYLGECKVEGVDPAPFVVNHLQGTVFTMRHRYLGMRALLPFARAMQKNTTVEYLNLSDNHLDSEGSEAIAEMMRDNCYVTRLDVSHNLMGTPGARAFASMLETNYTLKVLCLKANHLTDKDAQLIAEGLKNNVTLTDLDLSCNDFGEMAGVHLGKGLAANDGLVYLDLGWNAIRAKGVLEIANALKVNTSLETLDLSKNSINLPGCQAVLRALKLNQGLKILDLSHNHITSEGARKLSLGLKKNETLEALLLNGNRIGDVGVLALLKVIGSGNTGVKVLGLQDIPLPVPVLHKCVEIQATKGVHILRLDVDGRRKFRPPSHVSVMVDQFIAENVSRFLSTLFHLDEDKKGVVSSEAIIKALLDLGIDMSKEELETALLHVGGMHRQSIPYLPLLDGLAVLQDKAL